MMVQVLPALITPQLFPKTKTGVLLGNAFFWLNFCVILQTLVVRMFVVCMPGFHRHAWDAC